MKRHTVDEWREIATRNEVVWWLEADGESHVITVPMGRCLHVGLRGDGDGDITLWGSGRGNAWRIGAGRGSVCRRGFGVGDACRDGSGIGRAWRDDSGDGNAIRSGSGNGPARRGGGGRGNAIRLGPGNGDAWRGDDGRGDAYCDVAGHGLATREGSGDGVECDFRGTRHPIDSDIEYPCTYGNGYLRIGCEIHTLEEWIADAEEIDARHEDGIAAKTRALAEKLKEARQWSFM